MTKTTKLTMKSIPGEEKGTGGGKEEISTDKYKP